MSTGICRATSLRKVFDPGGARFQESFRLPAEMNPFSRWKHIDIIGVALYGPELPSLKAFVVRHLLEEADRRGKLKDVHTLVEATSGNTGHALGLLAPEYGIRKVVAIVRPEVGPGKRLLLRRAGVEVKTPDSDYGLSTIAEARRLGKRAGWHNLGQYDNPANAEAHSLLSGRRVWTETSGEVSVVSVPLGTGGTAIGVSDYLKQRSWNAWVVGAAVAATAGEAKERTVPGARTLAQLGEVTLPWNKAVREIREVDAEKAYRASLALHNHGFMVGPSSGLALAALIAALEQSIEGKYINTLRNAHGNIVAAFTCGDGYEPYQKEFAQYGAPAVHP